MIGKYKDNVKICYWYLNDIIIICMRLPIYEINTTHFSSSQNLFKIVTTVDWNDDEMTHALFL